jgi:hypothetical protein
MTLACWIVGWLLGGPEVRIATFQTEAMMEGMLTPARDAPLEGMLNWVAYAATGIELLTVVLIVGVIALANVLVLGLLVLIRTFLNWSLVLEIEER